MHHLFVHLGPTARSLPALLAALIAAACSTTTEPVALSVTVEAVVLHSEADFEVWPATPVITGGAEVSVAGTAHTGCGTIAAAAHRSGRLLVVRITSRAQGGPCLATTWAWQPFVVRVAGLEPGSYTVRVTTVGHTEHQQAQVTVTGGTAAAAP